MEIRDLNINKTKQPSRFLKQPFLDVGTIIAPLVTIGCLALARYYFEIIDTEIFNSLVIGFIAQCVDGALGMAYGVTATTVLLNIGVSPASVSASVHTAEIFTSGISGFMHLKFRNVNKKLLKVIVIPGMLGAVAGAAALSYLEDVLVTLITPLVSLYTFSLGTIILLKAFRGPGKRRKIKKVRLLATFGGFMDGVGGGGWGPIVSSTLIAIGRSPLYTIGSVNLAEFFVSIASAFTFVLFIGLVHWKVVLGLIIGGLIAAPLAIRAFRQLPIKAMMILVSLVVIGLSARQFIKLFI